MEQIVSIDEKLCTGCSSCVTMCPKRILYIDASSAKCRVTDEKKCDKLGGCERVCPAGAIKIR
jgi:2-oxoglutarate ferredoxin oxidoreductase subunit delta